MIARGGGKIINIASLQSEAARYSASKGAVKNLIKSKCTVWCRHGLQINDIHPGYLETPLNQVLIANLELLPGSKTGRWWRAGTMSTKASTCIFIASEASSFINGHIVYVDGGVLATL